MRGLALIFLCCFASRQVTPEEIKVECRDEFDPPQIENTTPSFLADLKVTLLTVGGKDFLNISWAINIDASIQYLTGTLIRISNQQPYLCEYNPNLSKAKFTGSKQRWFHYLVRTSYGSSVIQAWNLPYPPKGSGDITKHVTIDVPRRKQLFTPDTPTSTGPPPDVTPVGTTTPPLRTVTFGIFGGLAGLMILSFCYIIFKNCGANIAKPYGFKCLSTSPMAPVPVLMVYSAENSAFQQAVVALAEFLQWQASCRVAVDMWQQGKIAELGPMRWLAEQVRAADRVLIVCPEPSSQPSHSPPSQGFPEPSIPAAAYDLYPLILNMVASHAKSASELAKFWVVQLGKQQDKRPSNLALELRGCKTFGLMKNLNQLCMSLHTQRQDNKGVSNLIFKPGIFYSEKSTVKLREAVEKLIRDQQIFSNKVEPLKSVVTSV